MREFGLAVRTIWSTWVTGTPLDFRGDFYTHTLMSPLFDPGPNPFGPPPLLLSGVGPVMTEMAGAGEVAMPEMCGGRPAVRARPSPDR